MKYIKCHCKENIHFYLHGKLLTNAVGSMQKKGKTQNKRKLKKSKATTFNAKIKKPLFWYGYTEHKTGTMQVSWWVKSGIVDKLQNPEQMWH